MYNTFNNLCIMVTHGCNFACEYCFNHDVGKTMISEETAIKAIDIYVANAIPEGGELNILFFGGEPTLNMPLIKNVKKYCREKYPNYKWKFHITTNFSMLTADVWEEIILDKDFVTMISIDGTREHNVHRIFKDGTPTFDTVMGNINKIKNNDFLKDIWNNITIRSTFSIKDINTISDRFNFLVNNFGDRFVLMNVDEDDWRQVDYEEYKKQIFSIMSTIENRKNPNLYKTIKFFYDNMKAYQNRLLGINTMTRSCASGDYQFAVDYSGNFSPCHRFTNVNMLTDKYIIGDVENGINDAKLEWLRSLNSIKINDCENKGCKRFGDCAFGCFAAGVTCSSDFSPQCNGRENILRNMFEYNQRIIEEILESNEHVPMFYRNFNVDIRRKNMENKIKALQNDNEKLKEIVGKIIPMLDFMGNKLDK